MSQTEGACSASTRSSASASRRSSGSASRGTFALFREDLFHYANDQKGLGSRLEFRAWAQIYATAVELNSRVQNYGPP
jgi:hypothetical protein